MLNNKGFDDWAGDYDDSIERLSKGYPFEGYYDTLGYIYKQIKNPKNKKILDIGVGTGLLTRELYQNGAIIYGVDFSQEMLSKAKEKMPNAFFIKHDFKYSLPNSVMKERLDYIVSSYAFHHVDEDRKVSFILELKEILKSSGKIIIGDVGFETREKLSECKNQEDYWDESEYYLIADEIVDKLRENNIKAEYTQISSCAGVLGVEQYTLQ